ncbi:MAG: hypothetical protein AAFO75_00340 [Pseudomonadota bacterium]
MPVSLLNRTAVGLKIASGVVLMVGSIAIATAAPAPETTPSPLTGAPSKTPGLGDPAGRGSAKKKRSPESAAAKQCREEVAQAFATQRDTGAFSMKTRMIDQRGVVFMTVDYQLPTNMRQRVKTLSSPDAVETILVAGRAWTRTGEAAKWQPLKQEQVGALADQLAETVVEPAKDPLRYRCTEDISVDGKTLKTYQGTQVDPLGKVEPNSPIRIVHVEEKTGLPVMNAVAPTGQPDKPFFKATYSYPSDLTITPPVN